MHVVIFTSDDQVFAIPTRCVVEVIPVVHWRPLPGSESWIKGLFNYRAALLPLVDFDLLLATNERPLHRTARILVLRTASSPTAAAQSARLGLLVQRVLGSEQLQADQAIAWTGKESADQRTNSPGKSPPAHSADLPIGAPASGQVPSGIGPIKAIDRPSLLGPVMLTPSGMIQLIRVDGIPTPEHS